MTSLNIYYTYAWLRLDGTPYYIGKGSYGRAFDRRRRYCPSPDRILILKKNLTEEEAFKHEIYMISIFGRKDIGTGILHNKTNGGEGASGYCPTAETIIKLKLSHLGKKHTQKTKDKMSRQRRGKPRPDKKKPREIEVRQKISKTMTGKKKSKNHCQRISEATKGVNVGKTWWVNEENKNKFCHECPGPEWTEGRKWKG